MVWSFATGLCVCMRVEDPKRPRSRAIFTSSAITCSPRRALQLESRVESRCCVFYRTFTSSAILRTLCPVRNLGSLSRAQRGFVETPSKYCPNGQKNGRARRLAREKQVFEVRCAHPRPPQSSCSAAIRIADAASTSRDIAAKVFHLKSPADRPARFGVLMFRRAPPPAVLS